jgi:hypothetical protein
MWHKLLQLQFAPQPRALLDWMVAQGVGATLAAYGGSVDEGRVAANGGAVPLTRWIGRLRAALQSIDGHQQLMSALVRAAHVDDRTLLFVSAGIDPARPLAAQGDSFWWNADGFDRLEGPFEGFARVVRGFDPKRGGVAVDEWSICLDGGCGFGGTLIAGGFDGHGELVELVEA